MIASKTLLVILVGLIILICLKYKKNIVYSINCFAKNTKKPSIKLESTQNLMLKPNGCSAQNIDPLLLLNLWAHYLDRNTCNYKLSMIFAGLGKPSYFLDEAVAREAVNYWQGYARKIEEVRRDLSKKKLCTPEEQCNNIAQSFTAIDYGLPTGDQAAKEIMAQALSNWYEHPIEADDIIFTVGGMNGLKMLFRILNTKKPQGRIITPNPHYPFYNNPEHHNNLYFIDVMKEPGYRLTAQAVEKSIQDVNELSAIDGNCISAFLFCDPSNPLGTVINKQEWKKIAAVLKTTSPQIPIIIDEAYTEMIFDGNPVSLLQIAPELKNRIIILRSATKSLSASGERMAVIVCFDSELKEEISDTILLSYVHAPKSLQYIYARALLDFSKDKRNQLARFYQIQSNYVQERLRRMNALLPDPVYKPESTFYVLADLSDIMGSKIPAEAAKALGKTGIIETDVDICYSLLFEDKIMISALSFFGVDPKKGYVRITCSGGIAQLSQLMDRLEKRIRRAREIKDNNRY